MTDRATRWMRFAAVVLAFVLMAGLGPLFAAEPGFHTGVLTDPAGSLTIADIENRRFTPFTANFGGGFQDGIYWIRIDADKTLTDTQVVRLRPTAIDRITLYSRESGGGWRVSQSGEVVPATGDALRPFIWYSFRLLPQQGRGPWFLRIDTTAAAAIRLAVVPAGQVLAGDLSIALVQVFNLALFAFAAALAVATLAPLRSQSNLAFLAMTVTAAGYVFVGQGYGREVLGLDGGAFVQTMQIVMTTLALATVTTFHCVFLREYEPAPRVQRAALLFAALSWSTPVVAMAGAEHAAIVMGMVFLCLLPPVLAALLLSLGRDPHDMRRLLRQIYTAYIGLLCLNVMTRLGWVDIERLYRHGIEAISMITSAMLVLLVWLQNRRAVEAELLREMDLKAIAVDMQVASRFREMQDGQIREIEVQADRVRDATQAMLDAGDFGAASARARRSILTLHTTVSRCLLALQTEENRWNLRPVVIDAGAALQTLALALDPVAPWHFSGPSLVLTTDRDLFDVVMQNLLGNALRYGASGRPIAVTSRREMRGGRAGVAVSVQNACAMRHPFDPDQVFDKFYRGPSARLQTGGGSGTGLGLYITRRVLGALSGEMSLDALAFADTAGSLVTATVWLPEAA